MGPRFGRAQARSYDEYLKAYSVAMLPGRERDNLSYGGKSACFISSRMSSEFVKIFRSHYAPLCFSKLDQP